MIAFVDSGSRVVLVYSPEGPGSSWLDDKLASDGEVTLSRTFTVGARDLQVREIQDDHDFDEEVRRFVIGTIDHEYRTIRKDVLGLKHDLLIALPVNLHRRTFVAERNISIFRRIDELVEEQIVVGGPASGAIPEDEFVRLLHEFPTSAELTHYSRKRVTHVLREYLETMSDAEKRLAVYMERRARSAPRAQKVDRSRNAPAVFDLEAAAAGPVADRGELRGIVGLRRTAGVHARDAGGPVTRRPPIRRPA